MSLKTAIDNLKFDSRMTDINFKSQSLSQEEHQKHLDKLPDTKAGAVQLELEGKDHDDSDDNAQ